jgi:DTW domain-containing protein YfiP
MDSATKLLILMHPHEARKVKNGTGRLTALSFKDAELLVGVSFQNHPRLLTLVSDPAYLPLLIYPGPDAVPICAETLRSETYLGRRLLAILLDATWPLARKMFRETPSLHGLPRFQLEGAEKSRWRIKRQPAEHCLSTLEAVHELMLALEHAGLGRYERPGQLLAAFQALQDFQLSRSGPQDKRSCRGERKGAMNA